MTYLRKITSFRYILPLMVAGLLFSIVASVFARVNVEDRHMPMMIPADEGGGGGGGVAWRHRIVNWIDRIGVSVDDYNIITKTAPTGWGNGGAASLQNILADGSVEFSVNEINTTRICGLSYGNPDANYNTIDYGILLNCTLNNQTNITERNLQVYELGVKRGDFGTFASGEQYSVERTGGNINYKRNGSTFYTHPIISTGTLLVDAAFNPTGSTLSNVYVNAPNNPPVAIAQSLSTYQDIPINYINFNATDLDNDTLTYSIVNNPAHGTLSGAPPFNMTYTPTAGFYGLDGFSFKAYDGYDYSNNAGVSINVYEVNHAPNIPSYPQPINNATAIPIINTILSWLGGDPDQGDTVKYDLYFGNQTNPALAAANLTANNYALGTLNYNTTYYWKVKSTDNHGNYTQGPEWNFITEQGQVNNPPNTPRALYPENGSTGIPIIDTILNWLGGDPDTGDTVLYDLYFGESTSPALLAGNLTGVSYELGTLDYNTTYYWKVKSTDNHGSYTQGPVWDFMTETINNPPVALNQNLNTWQDTSLNNIILQATDLDNDTLTYFILSDPMYGSLSGTPPLNLTYTPNTGFLGQDGFTFNAYDGRAYSNVASINIDVYKTYQWSVPVRLDSGTGAGPTLLYAPNGDLRVFYNEDSPSNRMVVRKRINGQSVFEPETFVYGDAETVDIHYDASGKLDLAVETGTDAIILQSLDEGYSWDFIKSYPTLESGAAPKSLPLAFTEDNPDRLRLFYGGRWHGYLADWSITLYAERINDTWSAGSSFRGSNVEVQAAYENGDKVSVFDDPATGGDYSVFHSTDNGNTYNYGGVPVWNIAVSNTGRLYAIGDYYDPDAPMFDNHDLNFYYSDDDGTTWSIKQPIVDNSRDYFYSPHLAVEGNKMVAAWIGWDSYYRFHKSIAYVVSEDGGNTWSPVQTIISRERPAEDIDLKAIDLKSYNGKFTLAYSLLNETGRDGVYLMELNLPSSAPVLNAIPIKVYSSDVGGGGLLRKMTVD